MSEFNWDAFLQMLKGAPGICDSAFKSIKKAVQAGKGEVEVPIIPKLGEVYGQYGMVVEDASSEPDLVSLASGSFIHGHANYEQLGDILVESGWKKVADSLQEFYTQEMSK